MENLNKNNTQQLYGYNKFSMSSSYNPFIETPTEEWPYDFSDATMVAQDGIFVSEDGQTVTHTAKGKFRCAQSKQSLEKGDLVKVRFGVSGVDKNGET